jgi:hypothetical protein
LVHARAESSATHSSVRRFETRAAQAELINAPLDH